MRISRDETGRMAVASDDGVAFLEAADAACEVGGSVVSLSDCRIEQSERGGGETGGLSEVVQTTVVVGNASGIPLRLTWTLQSVANSSGIEVSLAVENIGTAPVQIERMWPLRGSMPSFPSSAPLTNLSLGAGSWGKKSLEELGDEGEGALISALVDQNQAAAVCGFTSFGRHRGFVVWSRGDGQSVSVAARHELGGEYSQRSASAGSAGAPEDVPTDDPAARDVTSGGRVPQRPGLLMPGETLASESLFFCVGEVFPNLEMWADIAGQRHDAVFMDPPATGFYTWYYYRERVSEEIILSNARYLAANRDRLPVNYVHLDWGWQGNYSCGNRELNPGFDHGLASLVEEIRALGFVPGIWLNAFMHDYPSSAIVVDQPELFQTTGDGTPASFGEPIRNIMADWMPDMKTHRDGKQHRIDPTAPGVPDYLRERYAWARDLGFGMVMLDFFLHGVWTPEIRPADPGRTWEEALRNCLSVIRETIGEETMIMGCGAPFEPMVGHGNFVRVASDISTHWPSVKNGSKPLLWQYFMHNRLWTNYADAVSVRGTPSPYWSKTGKGEAMALSLDEARFYVTVTGLTGAAVMIAEDLPVLERERQDLLTLILPICDEGSFRPVDLFPSNEPQILRRSFSRSDATWSVVGMLNWDDEEHASGVEVEALMKDSGARAKDTMGNGDTSGAAAALVRYHVFDVFANVYLGELGLDEVITRPPAHGARLLRITPVLDRPQLIGTTTHMSQGGVETTTERWDEAPGRLTIGLADLEGRTGEFVFSVPQGWSASGVLEATLKTISVSVVLDGKAELAIDFARR